MFKPLFAAGALATAAIFTSAPALATIVEFETVLGKVQVNLYDETTPETVENFLSYVESGTYDNTFLHRLVPEFILQGGGFAYDEDTGDVDAIETADPVVNEPEWSNRRGTIAMAKQGGDPNSATSQWFFNLENNHENLDVQNGGFTVFGEVISGMSVLEDIAELPRFNLEGAFTNLPLRNYGEEEIENDIEVSSDHLVVILSVRVIDDAENSAADLDPVPNTLIDTVGDKDSGGSSGGAMGWLALLALLGLGKKVGWIRPKAVIHH